jgi:hypothetical protein
MTDVRCRKRADCRHPPACWIEGKCLKDEPPQAAPHAVPMLPTQAALDSPRIDMPPSLSPEEKGAFMLGVAAGNAAPHAAKPTAVLLHCGICGIVPEPKDHCFCIKCGAVLVTQEEVKQWNQTAVLVEALRPLRMYFKYDEYINGPSGDPRDDRLQLARAAIASIERTLSQTQEPT